MMGKEFCFFVFASCEEEFSCVCCSIDPTQLDNITPRIMPRRIPSNLTLFCGIGQSGIAATILLPSSRKKQKIQ